MWANFYFDETSHLGHLKVKGCDYQLILHVYWYWICLITSWNLPLVSNLHKTGKICSRKIKIVQLTAGRSLLSKWLHTKLLTWTCAPLLAESVKGEKSPLKKKLWKQCVISAPINNTSQQHFVKCLVTARNEKYSKCLCYEN